MSSFTEGLKYEFTGTFSEFGIPQYVLLEEFSYSVGSLENPVAVLTVPAGTVTDFASIPWPINIWVKPTGPWAKAAALHDYLYWTHPEVDKLIFDGIFYEACQVLGVKRWVAILFFCIIRVFQTFSNK